MSQQASLCLYQCPSSFIWRRKLWFLGSKNGDFVHIFRCLGVFQTRVWRTGNCNRMHNNTKRRIKEEEKSQIMEFLRWFKEEFQIPFSKNYERKNNKKTWETLQQEFEGDWKVRTFKLMSLKTNFENEKMKENESLNEYFNRLTDLLNQMKSHGDTIEDWRIMDKIVISLIEKFNPMMVVIEETKDLSTMFI